MLKGAWNWIELAYSFSIAKGKILVIPELFQFPFTSEQISHNQHVASARVAWEHLWETFSLSVSIVIAIQTWKIITSVIATTQMKKRTTLAHDWWADRKWTGSLELLWFLIYSKIIYALEQYLNRSLGVQAYRSCGQCCGGGERAACWVPKKSHKNVSY